MKRLGIAKYLATYMVATAIVAGSIFAGATIQSEAESYIRYDNIIIRDSANGEILGGIAKGTEVEVVESATGSDGKQWNHVKYAANGTTHEGWVRADLMTEDRSLVEPDEQPQTQQPEAPEATEPNEEDTPTAEPDENEPLVDGELEVVIPLAEVSGEGYEATGDKTFAICGKSMTITSDFPEDSIPADFEKSDIDYNGETVKGVSYKYGDISLVYLKDDSGQGEFFVLDEQRQVVHSYIRIFADSNSLILLVPLEDMPVASSYNRTLYATDEDTGVIAYQFSQQSELMDIGTNVAEYFYVYGITKNGVPDWYLVDDGEGTFIRATADLAVELDALSGTEIVVQPMEEESTLEKMIIVVMAAIILILFIMVIVFGVRSFRARRGYYEEDDYEEEEELSFIQKRREERKYRRFMENFEEEGDEDVEDLLPRKKVEAYLKEAEEEEQETVEDIAAEPAQPQDTMVLPPVDTVILKEIMAEQELEAKAKEKNAPDEEKEEAEEAVSTLLEQAVALEMPMDDYDIDVSDEEDFDLTDDNSEADEKEYDEIEKILLAGLAELEAKKESKEPKKENVQAYEAETDEVKVEEEQDAEEKDDEWKDLEFLDI